MQNIYVILQVILEINLCHTWNQSWDIGLSGILQSNWSRACRAKTPNLYFWQAYNFEWVVKYHNNYPFRPFKENKITKDP